MEGMTFENIHNSSDGIIIIDPKGIIRDFDIASEQIFGFSKEEVINCTLSTLIPD